MITNRRSPLLYQIISHGRAQEFKKDGAVYTTSNANRVFYVEDGFIKRYMIKNDGALGVQIVYGPQDIFSFTNIYAKLLGQRIYDGPETYYYKAMCLTKVFTLDLDTFKRELFKTQMPYKELFAEAGYHLRYCVHNIENIGLESSYARVCHQLLYFVRAFGLDAPEGRILEVPFTHQDLADVLGLTRETVSLTFKQLRQNKVILTRRQIIVPDVARLAEEAYASDRASRVLVPVQ